MMMDPKWHKFSCIFPGSSNVGFQIQPFVNILQLVEQFFAGVQFSGQWVRPLLPNCQPVRIQKPILLPNRTAFASPHNKCTTTRKYANHVNVTTHTFDIGGIRAPQKIDNICYHPNNNTEFFVFCCSYVPCCVCLEARV